MLVCMMLMESRLDDVASKWFIGEPINVNYDYKIIGVWQIADPSNPTGQQDPNYRHSYLE